VIVEVGSWRGRSTRALADHCRGVVYAVDPWGGVYYQDDGSVHPIRTKAWPIFQVNLRDHLRSGRVRARQGFSADVLPVLAAELGATADLVFIDGDHRHDAVRADIAAARHLVRPGGILSGHDYGHDDWPGVQRAVDEVFDADRHLVNSIWWTEIAA